MDVLFGKGAVVELRAFGMYRDVVSGYYDDFDAMTREALTLDQCGYQVYVTLNEVDPDLLARAANKTTGNTTGKPKGATTDKDVTRRRWLLVDVDPVRSSDTSASREEKAAAMERARDIARFLRGKGWPDPVAVDSGNGYHLLYRVGLPNDEKSKRLVKRVLKVLASRFDDDRVKVDKTVHNAARLIRLPGTVNKKGRNSAERPYRRSRILDVKKEGAPCG